MPKIIKQRSFPKQMPKPKRVAAYARVSSAKDAMHHSLSAQVSHYSSYIQSHPGWEYVGVYADEAKTGTKENREQFQKLLADCRAGKIDIVLTKSVSRFARNTVTLLETVRELKGLGVDVHFEEQNIHTLSADGELMLSILASFAQAESQSVSENQKWRVKKNFSEGKPWSATLLGYRYHDGKLVIEPTEAEIVRRVFAEYLSGKGFVAIANGLRADGIPTRQGGTWCKATISKMLRNYTYTGNLLLQKTFNENYMTKRKCTNHGELPMYHAVDTHEAIIDMDTFQAVQTEIDRRAKKYTSTEQKIRCQISLLRQNRLWELWKALPQKNHRRGYRMDLLHLQFPRQSSLCLQANPGEQADRDDRRHRPVRCKHYDCRRWKQYPHLLSGRHRGSTALGRPLQSGKLDGGNERTGSEEATGKEQTQWLMLP